MSLKLPGVQKKLDKYAYSVALDNEGRVCFVNIIYKVVDTRKETTIKHKCFLIYADFRWQSIERIVDRIKETLVKGLGENSVTIKEYPERLYLYFGNDQFTGQSAK